MTNRAPQQDPVALATVARRVADGLGWRQRRGGSTSLRSGARLVAEDDYEVWLLCWPAGSRVTPHDHGPSAGAFVVISGELTELRWPGPGAADQARSVRHLVAGEVVEIARGVVHDVVALRSPAYSIHAYSPPLQTMSFYADDGRTVLRTEVVKDTPSEFVEESVVRS